MKKMNSKSLLLPLELWIALTAVYGLALFAVGNYEVLSFIYHIGLLAIALWCAKGMLESGLGFRIGNWRYGIILVASFLGFLILHSVFYSWPTFAFTLDLATFTTVFFAPITEEIFWRGLIQQRMQSTKMDPLIIIITNAAGFAAMHIPKLLFFNETPFTFISILFVGIVFSSIFYLTKSVYYSTATHMLENIFTL